MYATEKTNQNACKDFCKFIEILKFDENDIHKLLNNPETQTVVHWHDLEIRRCRHEADSIQLVVCPECDKESREKWTGFEFL
jgi:hypothetical protein